MALSAAEKKMMKLMAAVRNNPNSNQAWAALMNESERIALSLRDALVQSGRMQLVA